MVTDLRTSVNNHVHCVIRAYAHAPCTSHSIQNAPRHQHLLCFYWTCWSMSGKTGHHLLGEGCLEILWKRPSCIDKENISSRNQQVCSFPFIIHIWPLPVHVSQSVTFIHTYGTIKTYYQLSDICKSPKICWSHKLHLSKSWHSWREEYIDIHL